MVRSWASDTVPLIATSPNNLTAAVPVPFPFTVQAVNALRSTVPTGCPFTRWLPVFESFLLLDTSGVFSVSVYAGLVE